MLNIFFVHLVECGGLALADHHVNALIAHGVRQHAHDVADLYDHLVAAELVYGLVECIVGVEDSVKVGLFGAARGLQRGERLAQLSISSSLAFSMTRRITPTSVISRSSIRES